ncbi:MAG: UvrD-helicase domain-containing protein [Candidatus Methanomethylophilaceae archaeon]|nr:UvrD-helicase domain-containing protein [Candidatus Methanomethylophilaceae archaeon]
MPGLNERQREIESTTDGLMVVDAGPGTGKTHTITERYINLIKKDVSAAEVLMVTFTRNSAAEMRDRIRRAMIKKGNELKAAGDPAGTLLLKARDEIRTSTFDAFCLRIVLGSPEVVSEFFGFGETLSRGATLVENETLNREYFSSFYAEFSKEYGHLYRTGIDYPAIMADGTGDLYDLLVRLMSYGIIPLDDDSWFNDGGRRILGDEKLAFDVLAEKNGKDLALIDGDKIYADTEGKGLITARKGVDKDYALSEGVLREVAEEDRRNLVYFIRHVYYEYIRQSVRDNRLTFSLVKIMAFAVLYQSEEVRDQNSVEYMMVDEFQDTDELQLMICLMLLKKGNLCAVGDWKQGIYGFRNASVNNILYFKEKVRAMIDSLGRRVRFAFGDQPFKEISLDRNYRSTTAILDPAFKAMEARGSEKDVPRLKEGSVTRLTPDKEEGESAELYLNNTATEYWYSDSKDQEYSDLVDRITEYVYSGRYSIVEDGKLRQPTFGHIGVLFRTVKDCNLLYEEAERRHIPVFLQGDMEIMSSRPGKLALAWLRFINDSGDKRGIAAILVHEGFRMPQIRKMFGDEDTEGSKGLLSRLPQYLVDERDFLMRKRRRPNDLLTSIFAFHRIGEDDEREADMAQAIINIVSSSYDGSLITLPDIIRLFEEDIEQSTRYGIDAILGTGAVTIQTMHKSKGLQYPIVIVGGISSGRMPSTKKDTSLVTYDPVFGVRCRRETVSSPGGVDGVVNSWRFKVISNARESDYDEERRLLFVSMSRAEQYMTVASGPKPSKFYEDIAGKDFRGDRPKRYPVPETDRSNRVTEDPVIPEYRTRRQNIAVHDLMVYKEGAEDPGKGKEYGNRVHEAAQQMVLGKKCDETLEEVPRIREVLNGLGGAVFMAELDCALPVGDVTVRGTIDLLADFGDHIEIHDWKTDVDRRNLDSYITQLSVYYHAAHGFRDVPVRCFIQFLHDREAVEVRPLTMDEIEEKVEAYCTQSLVVDTESDTRTHTL